jgi:uncharacterized protein (UPF0332 family)
MNVPGGAHLFLDKSRTGKIAKTHSGLRSEFCRLAREEPRIGKPFPAFLGKAYALKTIADYEVDTTITISARDASAAIEIATQFIECIFELLKPLDSN